MKRDSWQTVIPDRVFVYSSHLDPWSRNEIVIHILAPLSKDEMKKAIMTPLYCKIWIGDDTGQLLTVKTALASCVTDLDYQWDNFK